MSSVIERNCKTPHCPNPAIRSDYCLMCKVEKKIDYRFNYKTNLVNKHGSNFYQTQVWRKLRTWYIRNNPSCVGYVDGKICGQIGQHVDHIVPISKGGSLTSVENLQTLCIPCHTRKTRLESKN